MPRFKVLMRVDAFVDYTTEVEAPTATEAADIAYRDEESFVWVEADVHQYDARRVVTLDDKGHEMEETAHGKF